MHRAILPTLLLAATTTSALAASNDNNVEWDGVSHVWFHDRAPLCPVNGESFEVRFQAYRFDLTGARVVVIDGSGTQTIDASIESQRGPYDTWVATIPATASTQLRYYIELTDGADTDFYSSAGMRDLAPATSEQFLIDSATLSHAPVGATPVAGGVVFKVWAPGAASAHVRGTFNGWGTANQMQRDGEHFVEFVAGAQPGHMYKYYFNGVWKPDARGRRLNPIDNDNTFVIDPVSYQWQTAPFSPPATEDLVIYQLHVGSFAGRNDPAGSTGNPSGYRDVGDRAAHLAELGINAVMLNPVNEFPGDFSGGYNPKTAWALEWKYGTPDDFKYMVDQLHAHGVAVLLDIVWNHFSVSENFLWDYDGSQIYFDSPHIDTPWGAQADFDRQGVRDYYLDSVVLMLDEYRLDGFRMDATSFMDTQGGAGWSLMQALNDLADNRYADKTIIAEQLPDNPWVTRPTSLGGAGFDSQYHDAFTDELRSEIFDSGFGDPEMWRIRNIINGSGQYLENETVVNYFELHDEAWTLSGGQRAVVTIDTTSPHDDVFAVSRTKLAQALTILAPGVPAFLMGTEWLEDAGFESEKIDWSKKTSNADIFAFYADLLDLRVGNTALRASSPHQVTHLNEGGNVIAFQRYNLDGLVYLVVANFSNNDYGAYRVGLPFEGSWVEVISSNDGAYRGSGLINASPVQSEPVAQDGFAQSAQIALGSRTITVLQLDNAEPDCSGDITTTGAADGDPGFGSPDGVTNLSDLLYFVNVWNADLGTPSPDPSSTADVNTTGASAGDPSFGAPDGNVDLSDLLFFVNEWTAGLAQCP